MRCAVIRTQINVIGNIFHLQVHHCPGYTTCLSSTNCKVYNNKNSILNNIIQTYSEIT